MKKNHKGSTLVELIMVMLLLILFGITISTLIHSGGEAQEKIISEKNAQIDARIALSYLNMKIRQNDSAEKISIEKTEITGENAIVIKVRYDSMYDDWIGYDTWIYWADGFIYECLTDPGEQPEIGLSFRIAEAGRFDTAINENGAIVNTIFYNVNGVDNEMQSTIFLRSGR